MLEIGISKGFSRQQKLWLGAALASLILAVRRRIVAEDGKVKGGLAAPFSFDNPWFEITALTDLASFVQAHFRASSVLR